MTANTLFFSTEPGVYHGWQSRLLVNSAKKHLDDSQWSIVRAVAIFPDASVVNEPLLKTLEASGCNIHIHSNYAAEITSADCYSPYNKILALKSFISENHLPNEHLLTIIDPDFLVVDRFEPQAQIDSLGGDLGNAVYAEKWTGLEPSSEFGLVLGEFLGLDTEHWRATPSVGVPVTLSIGHLKTIINDWLELTIAIRRGFNSGELVLPAMDAWCAEMWGFMAAVAKNRLPITTLHSCRFAHNESLHAAAFVHYCHAVNDNQGQVIWDKRWYEPSAGVPFAPSSAATEVGSCILNWLGGE
jgi:hypothetical protein